MERVNVDGVELEYEVAGSGETVVMIHGALIADSFRPLLTEPSLVDRYQLVNYHRRGYAGSTTSGTVSVERQAADCLALLHHMGVGRAHVVGHSYGGVIAMQLALDAPEAIQSLALLEPALMVGESAQGYRESLVRGAERFREAGAVTAVDEFFAARFGEGHREAINGMVPGAFEQAVADAETSFEAELPALLNWSIDVTKARRISQPVLAVLGDESAALSPRFSETYEFVLEWMPNAEGFVLPDAAHGLQMQNPAGMAEALAEFFGRHGM